MAILNVYPDPVAQYGIVPSFFYINTDDTAATVLTAGYLNPVASQLGYNPTQNVALVNTTDFGANFYEITQSGTSLSLSQHGVDTINAVSPLTSTGGYQPTIAIGSPIPLSLGGTNADLSASASAGGLVYSTSTAFAVLAGTATANQIPLSGSSAAPVWSTATYPATVASGTVLGATTNNTVAALTTLPSAVQGNITSVGTITSGTWNGSVIAGQYGGTGVANTGKTITIGGNFAMSGAFTFTGTVTGNTAVTFPTSGTLATTSSIPSLPLSLANGGTAAALTASNGGIVYSGASALAILAGTSTANQALLSGSSTTPAWSTATYPATTTINQLLYSSAANTIAGLATANRGVLTTGATGVPVITALATDGQLIIGSTAGAPAAATISAGTGISVTNGSNSITIANTAAVAGAVKISAQNASASPTIDFLNLSSSYAKYEFVLSHIVLANDNTDFLIQVSQDNGSTWLAGTNYNTNGISYNRVSVAGYGADGQANIKLSARDNMTNAAPDADMNGVIHMTSPDAASASSYFTYLLMYYNGTNGWNTVTGMGAAYASNTINAVRFIASSGNITSGNITMYGFVA